MINIYLSLKKFLWPLIKKILKKYMIFLKTKFRIKFLILIKDGNIKFKKKLEKPVLPNLKKILEKHGNQKGDNLKKKE